MQKKITIVMLTTVVGAFLGAFLGYGPLLRYKSEAVLNVELGTSEYKRFAELARDANSLNQFIKINPPAKLQGDEIADLARTIKQGEWYKPVPKVSKVDAKELPDVVIQMERVIEKEKEKEKETQLIKDGKESSVYLGIRIENTASDAQKAADITTWLGIYFKEIAAREAVREKVARWTADNLQFSDQAAEQKLKYDFEIAQAKNKLLGFKRVISAYPSYVARESNQVVDVRKDNEKFISPTAQLVGAESEIIHLNEKINKLNREIVQAVFATTLLKDANAALKQSQSGSESVSKLTQVFTEHIKRIKTDAEREKLLSFTADLSKISSRFLSQAEFIAQPSAPARPEKPTPRMYIALFSLLFMCLAALYMWKSSLINFFRENTQPPLA